MLLANPRATRTGYPAPLQAILSVAGAQESRRWLSCWEALRPGPTPLYALEGLAQELGLGQVLLKDESVRSGLGSFKALGAPIALVRLVLRMWPHEQLDAQALFAGRHRGLLRELTVISATDGNHGRALAAAARSLGCRCVIVLHAHVSAEREQAIAAYGAEIVRITGNYDDSVAEAARLAAAKGWHVVSDTSYEGYEDIPRDVMQGYGTIAAEIVESLADSAPPTHVFLQGGVGGFAAAIVSYFWETCGARRPSVVVVEPEQADCLYQSALQGRPAKATGSVDSVMAGLACGETSPLAWRFLEPGADWFMTLGDDAAVAAMRRLARGNGGDLPIVAGESGAAGLAALLQLVQAPELASRVGLGRDARVLVVNTEGATAPSVYRQLVGEPADAVGARQEAFLQRRGGETA
ncbi:MAG TPA: diaminopropionate ammonia-lyase [Ramlibacter sp.]|uniref:diaminopropionate ammonia-lyase n=1 Tax=Ramlibacter sp. TaxID=1917967 RepID=UPI002D806CDF|nr:diaminopropionate ammonia-lyase [Ramlibacter sp.]HET8746358.1 diaminopropionate ammonia-lyase [Ramlibacter sp.]